MAQFYQAKKGPSRHSQKRNANKHSLTSNALKEKVSVTTLDHTGKGICLSTQPITIVEGALPDESCEVHVTQANKKVRTASLHRVLEPSAHRTQAFCAYYEKCGGCSMQHSNAEFALTEKVNALKTYLGRQHNIVAHNWTEAIKSNIEYFDVSENAKHGQITAYRRRIRLAIDARNPRAVKIGYRERGSQKVLNIANCPITIQAIDSKLPLINSMLQKLASITHIGHIVITSAAENKSYSTASTASENVEDSLQLALFVTKPLSEKSIQQLTEFSAQQHIQVVIKQKGIAPHLINSVVETLPMMISDTISQAVTADQFLQVNAGVNQKMLNTAVEWLSPNKDSTVYDFFCGSGNFSLKFASFVKQVFAYEGVPAMVSAANKNALDNKLHNCEFACCDLSDNKAISTLNISKGSIVILDPSREGANNLCKVLASKKVAKILYVSCNPNSFARDIRELQGSYEINQITALDMFPFTSHLEVMALLLPKHQ